MHIMETCHSVLKMYSHKAEVACSLVSGGAQTLIVDRFASADKSAGRVAMGNGCSDVESSNIKNILIPHSDSTPRSLHSLRVQHGAYTPNHLKTFV